MNQPIAPRSVTAPSRPLLAVNDLAIDIASTSRTVRAVDRISFTVTAGSTVALVGESGCGKSLTALAVMGLLPDAAKVRAGRVELVDREHRSTNLLSSSEGALARIRGRDMAMVFQDPMSALNPVHTVGAQIDEVLRLHLALDAKAARARTVELLGSVGIPSPSQRASAYPHELSGGMRQRVLIAMAVAGKPRVLVADEPTTALDVTVQAQVLALLRELRDESGMGVLLITHDLGVVAEHADQVLVMYAGRIVERAHRGALLRTPRHPYTRGLLASVPSTVLAARSSESRIRLPTIPGSVPAIGRWPRGCPFQDRCSVVVARCRVEDPRLEAVGDDDEDAAVACFITRDEGATP